MLYKDMMKEDILARRAHSRNFGQEKKRSGGVENVHRNSLDRKHDGCRNYGRYCLWLDSAAR